jgi:hypothetical protein
MNVNELEQLLIELSIDRVSAELEAKRFRQLRLAQVAASSYCASNELLQSDEYSKQVEHVLLFSLV